MVLDEFFVTRLEHHHAEALVGKALQGGEGGGGGKSKLHLKTSVWLGLLILREVKLHKLGDWTDGTFQLII